MVTAQLRQGDALELAADLEERSVDCVVTSPPYFRARDYGTDPRQIGGADEALDVYVERLAAALEALQPSFSRGAPVWLNLGSRHAAGGFGPEGPALGDRKAWDGMVGTGRRQEPPEGYAPRDVLPIPALLADRLRRRAGLVLRAEVVWSKPAAAEPPRRDRPSRSHEYLYLLTNGHPSRVRDPGEKWWKTSVWTIAAAGASGAGHPAAMPLELARRCIVASSRPRLVLDPFCGSGTTLLAAARLGLDAIGFELEPAFVELARRRLSRDKRALVVTDSDRGCAVCGRPLEGRSDRRTCSDRCRSRLRHRRRRDEDLPPREESAA